MDASILSDNKILVNVVLNDKLEHSKTLMPIIDNVLKISKINIEDINYIAVT